MIFSSLVILFYPVNKISYMVLLFASFFSIFSNGTVLYFFLKNKKFLSSASVSHIGVALMLIGILFSSGYSSIVSKNYTGLIWNKEFPDEVNQDNMLLFLNEEKKIGNYNVRYLGKRKDLKNYSEKINQNYLEFIPIINKYVLKKNIDLNDKTIFENDTIEVSNRNISYFEIEFKTKEGNKFTLFPKVQTDPNSDMIVFSPDVKTSIMQDLYVHVRTYPDPEQGINCLKKIQ